MKRLVSVLAIVSVVFALLACGSTQDRRDAFYDKAKKLVAEGRLQDAELELKNAIKIDPKFAKAYTLLGSVQVQARNWPGAFGNYQRATELDQEDLEAQLGLCKLFLLSQKLDKAEAKADFILQRQPGHVDAGVVKAIALTKQNRVDEAVAMLERLQQANPGNADVFIARSETQVARKDFAAAEAVLLDGLQKNPRHLLLTMQLANLYAQQMRLPEAEQRYQELVAIDPNNAGANMMLVNFYTQAGQPDKAAQSLAALAQRFPKEESYREAQAQAAESSGKPAEAEAILARAVQEIPESKALRVNLAEHHLRHGQFAKIEPLVQEMIQKDPDHPQTVAARRVLANAFVASQQPDKARAQLEAILKRNPRDIEGRLISGALNMQAGKPREAIVELREVVDGDPKNLRAHELLAKAHLQNGEAPLAEALLMKFVSDNPGNMRARMLLVDLFISTGKGDRAIGELNAVAGPNQQNPGVFLALGDLYTQKQNMVAAKNALKRACDLAPKDAGPRVKLGRLLWAGKDGKGALALFDQALALDPASGEAAEAKVGVLMQEKKTAEAMTFARQYAASRPDDAFTQALLGRVLMDTGDMAGAEAQLGRAVSLAPSTPAPYQYLGMLYMRQGKTDAGIAKFREAFAANPANPAAGLALATLLSVTGNRAEAAATYEKVLEKNPDHVPAINNLAYLYADGPGDPAELQKAQVLAEKLKAIEAPVSFDTIGWVQFKLGNKEEALRYLLRAWDKANGLPTIAFHLGVVYQAKGDNAAAAKWLEKSLATSAKFPERAAAQAELARLRGKK